MMIITNSDISIYQQCSVILYSEIQHLYHLRIMIMNWWLWLVSTVVFRHITRISRVSPQIGLYLGIYSVLGHGAWSFIQIMFKESTDVFFSARKFRFQGAAFSSSSFSSCSSSQLSTTSRYNKVLFTSLLMPKKLEKWNKKWWSYETIWKYYLYFWNLL